MKIFVVGATGPLGIFICQEALRRGHSLHIYARNPSTSKLPKDVSEHADVKVFEGQLDDADALTTAIQGCNAIVSALGPPLSPSILTFKRGTLMNPLATMMTAARASGIKKLIILGTPSAAVPGDTPPLSLRLFITFLKTVLNPVYTEIVGLGRMLDEQGGDLDWIMYRLGMLSDGAEKGGGSVTRAVEVVGGEGWRNATERRGTAGWVLEQVEDEHSVWVRKKPALYSVAA